MTKLAVFPVFLFSGLPLFMQATFRMPWWGWLLLFVAIILIVVLLIRGNDKRDAIYDQEPDTASIDDELFSEEAYAPKTTAAVTEPIPAETADDLTIIEGIGPKINDFLRRSGIVSFNQLAAMNMDDLDRMLAEANFGIADPETWAEQADLAAKGDWKGLKELQDTLTAGRRKK